MGKTLKTLNQRQQELVEKNHILIYEFAKEKRISVDEYYGLLAIGLCKAALAYDENRGKFSTIAYCCMSNELKGYWNYINKKSMIPKTKMFSYDMPVKDCNNENFANSYIDTIVDDKDMQNEIANNIMLSEYGKLLTEKERKVFESLIKGLTYTDIAEEMNCTKQNINYYMQQIRKKLPKLKEQINIYA